MTLATDLRSARLAAGLTQQRLAEMAGVSVATVCKIETGRVVRPRASTAQKIEQAIEKAGGK